MSFYDLYKKYSWDLIGEAIAATTAADVERVLQRFSFDTPAIAPGQTSLEDFLALISPAAAPYLEEMAQISQVLTQKRFGRTIQLYIPLYVSNECQNICTYCGFSYNNRIARHTLSDAEILSEVEVIKSHGYDHVLIVSGEAPRKVGIDYFVKTLRLLRPYFSNISIEVQPLSEDEYRILVEEGLHAVLVYQETYNEQRYRTYHPRGKKSNFKNRLDTPERIGRAGAYKIGLGALIGLEDWRIDSWFVALHLSYLRNKYWKTKYSISFPRLRPAEGYLEPNSLMSERELVQLICAYRLFDENVELSLSTRESARFRDNTLGLGITTMSAGSRTDPGGYASSSLALEQFSIDDNRSPAKVAGVIRKQGFDPVWKDWDRVFG